MTANPRRIVIFTLGSRGDVQPFLALALALQGAGHQICFVAPRDFETQIKSYDLEFVALPIDMNAMGERNLAKDLLDNGIFFWRTFKVIGELLKELQLGLENTGTILAEASREQDLIISHPMLAPFCITIQEKQAIPVLFGSPVPIAPTRDFPSPMLPIFPINQANYNQLSYWLALGIIFNMTLAPANKYRQSLGLKKLGMRAFLADYFKREVLFAFSRYLVPPSSDWTANVQQVGAWSLAAKGDWSPPAELVTFLETGEAPIYVGFGSMKVPNPEKTIAAITEGLRLTGRRGVLQAGWAGLQTQDERLINIGDCPHEWLFPRMAAIVHHGGAGTSNAAFRAGKPMLVVPVFGDQIFWASQSVKIGVGVEPIPISKFTAERFAKALRQLENPQLIETAARLGALAQSEDGLGASLKRIESILY